MKKLAEGNFGEFVSIGGHFGYPGYIIKGKKQNLMIEAGINMLGPLYLKSIEKTLNSKDRLDMLFLTHSHYDHLGAVPYLKRKIPSLKIGGSERIADLMKKPSVIERMTALSEIQRVLFRDAVGDEDVHLEPFYLDYRLKEGDRFDLGGLACEVYDTPGHTRDSISYYIPEIGALFPGEAVGVPVGNNGEIVQVSFLYSYSDYLNSLYKLIDLKPEMIGMAHMWFFTGDDARRYLDKSAEETGKYRTLIENYLESVNGDIEKAIDLIASVEYDEKGVIMQERNAYITNLKAQVALVADLSR
jgi:2-aminobenzoylacetyl-CoA thioesterase